MHKSNCRGASPRLLNHGLHAIDATPARWRGDAAGMVAFSASAPDSLIDLRAGYPWDCSSDRALDGYFTRADVQEALHLKGPGSGFKCGAAHESDLTPSPRRLCKHLTHTRFTRRYKQSGPASQLLWPHLVKNMRVLIWGVCYGGQKRHHKIRN